HLLFFAGAVFELGGGGRAIDQPGGGAGLNVGSNPKTGERWQVVSGGGNQGVLGVFAGAPEGAVSSFLKIEDAVAEDAEAGQGLANRGFDGAEVFADHQHLVADALERQNAHQILGPLAHVRAVGSLASVRYPKEAEEAHHVVDAERAAVPAVFADGFGEEAVS